MRKIKVNPNNLDFTTAHQSVSLVCVEAAGNTNKFWKAWVFNNGLFVSQHGRVGSAPQTNAYEGTFAEATRMMVEKVAEKYRKSYEPVMAESQTDTDLKKALQDPRVQSKIDQLRQTWRSVSSFSTIEFNEQTGVFQSPLGQITKRHLRRAESLISQIRRASSIQLIEEYFKVIPLKMKPGLDFSSQQNLSKQEELLTVLNRCFFLIEEISEILKEVASTFDTERSAQWLSWGGSSITESSTILSDERATYIKFS